MLNLIVPGSLRQIEVMAQFIGKERYRVFGYWELGPLLDGLGRGPEPAVLGLEEGPFDLALHDDQERHKRYRESRLRLTDLGHALLDGKADWATHTQLRYWWGGTRQTPENLWRWDAATERLIPP